MIVTGSRFAIWSFGSQSHLILKIDSLCFHAERLFEILVALFFASLPPFADKTYPLRRWGNKLQFDLLGLDSFVTVTESCWTNLHIALAHSQLAFQMHHRMKVMRRSGISSEYCWKYSAVIYSPLFTTPNN